jgi:hypothetical protein
MKDDTFITTYMEWTRKLEAPTIFHRWAALTAFSHALGRRVFCLHTQPIFPGAMYTLLVGPSGVRKSSAVHPAYELLLQAKARASDPFRIHVCPDRSSNESFFDGLIPLDCAGEHADSSQVDCVGFVFAPELSSIATDTKYRKEIPETLTDFYDKYRGTYDPVTRTLSAGYWVCNFKKGTLRLRNPSVTLLACTTPTALRESLPTHVQSAGFLARVLLVYAERSDRPANSGFEEDAGERVLADRLVGMLAQATKLEGPARLTAEALAVYEKWYLMERLRWGRLPEDAPASGFARRSQDHVLRTATTLACISILGHHTRGHAIPIEAAHLQAAIKWVRAIEQDMPTACGEWSHDKVLRCEDRVLRGIARWQSMKGGAPWKHVSYFVYNQRRDRFTADEVEATLLHLVERRLVRMHGETPREATYRLIPRKPGPWTGTPAQGPASDEYLAEQQRDWADEIAEDRRRDEIEREIEEGIRDRDGRPILH